MDKKVIKSHSKGQKHPGKTDWKRVIDAEGEREVDEENPDLVGRKRFVKPGRAKS